MGACSKPVPFEKRELNNCNMSFYGIWQTVEVRCTKRQLESKLAWHFKRIGFDEPPPPTHSLGTPFFPPKNMKLLGSAAVTS